HVRRGVELPQLADRHARRLDPVGRARALLPRLRSRPGEQTVPGGLLPQDLLAPARVRPDRERGADARRRQPRATARARLDIGGWMTSCCFAMARGSRLLPAWSWA